jgi:hypothetical protein
MPRYFQYLGLRERTAHGSMSTFECKINTPRAIGMYARLLRMSIVLYVVENLLPISEPYTCQRLLSRQCRVSWEDGPLCLPNHQTFICTRKTATKTDPETQLT